MPRLAALADVSASFDSSAAQQRIAVLGGDGRPHPRVPHRADTLIIFKSRHDGGNGEARRLESALRAGRVARVIILARWNSHEVTRRIRRLCRKIRVPVELVR